MTNNLYCLYSISDNGYKKPKLENATKKHCLENFLNEFLASNHIEIFIDKVTEQTKNDIEWLANHNNQYPLNISLHYVEGGSSAAAWRIKKDFALTLNDDDIVYFVEDDYFHLVGSREALLEAVERSDYVTLYDAPDKYVPAYKGGNPLIDKSGSDITRVILTKSRHWRLTNSTTMTFACKVKTLREDLPIWEKWTSENHPHDFQAFLELRDKGRSLISPLPSLSTHCEPAWLSPLQDWTKI